MARSWWMSRVALVGAALALLAGIPAVLAEDGVKDPWLLGGAAAVAAVVVFGAVWQHHKWLAQRRDDQSHQTPESTNPDFGTQDLDTLTSRYNLALVLARQGRLEEAGAEHRAVLEIRTLVLGAEHPDTLTSRDDLAAVLARLGRLKEAEAEHRAVLEIRTLVLGAEHPHTVTSRRHLAAVRANLNAWGFAAEC